MLWNPRIFCEFHTWLQPIFGLVATADDMNVHPLLLIGVYLECIFSLASENRTHHFVALGCKYNKKFPTIDILEEKVQNSCR